MQKVNFCLKLLREIFLKGFQYNLSFPLSLFPRFIFNAYPSSLILIRLHQRNK